MYNLMYGNTKVLSFNPKMQDVEVFHPSMRPFAMKKNDKTTYEDIVSFCSERVLMTNRKYFKEILNACEIDDQNDINICIISHALSFRDNYWIKKEDSNLSWNDINLYENEFSEDIAFTALTGKIKNIHLDDTIFTGELTSLGTRNKCFIRNNNNIYLAKNLTEEEISSEILSSYLCSYFNLEHAKYAKYSIYGKNCSVCKLHTSPNIQLIPARDVLSYYDAHEMRIDTPYYDLFLKLASKNFIKMQLFDYITLNTDRNRDNFALMMKNGKITNMYPLFDHDSCFKGKSTNAHYFVTGKSFKESLPLILSKSSKKELESINNDLVDFKNNLNANKSFVLKFKNEEIFNSLLDRTEEIFSEINRIKNLDLEK